MIPRGYFDKGMRRALSQIEGSGRVVAELFSPPIGKCAESHTLRNNP